MPIKGLTENRRLPRLGKIHLGIRNEKGYPMKVDYFVVPDEIKKFVGDKPRELKILIPVEDEEKWASQYYRCYSRTRGMVCKGDGETCDRLVNADTGEMVWKEEGAVNVVRKTDLPCKGRECPDYKVKCKEVMNLQFLLPDVPGLGVWQIDTGSYNSIRNINDEAAFIRAAYGRIRGLPLLLTLEPHQGKKPDRTNVMVYVMHLRTSMILSQMQALAAKPPEQVILELPVGDDEIDDLLLPENREPETKPQPAKAQTKPPANPPPPEAPAASVNPPESRPEKKNEASESDPLFEKPYKSPSKKEMDEFIHWLETVKGEKRENMEKLLGMSLNTWLFREHRTLAEARASIEKVKAI